MKSDWILRWEAAHPFFRLDAYFRAMQDRLVMGTDYERMLCLSRNQKLQMYYSKKDLERISRGSLKLLLNRKSFDDYACLTINICNELLKEIKDARKVLSFLSNRELAKKYESIIKKHMILFSSYDLSRPEYVGSAGKKIKLVLLKGANPSELEELFAVLTSITSFNILDHEEIDWLEILFLAKTVNPNNLTKRLMIHQQKYGWIGTSEQKQEWDIKHYKELLNKEQGQSEEQLLDQLKTKKEKLIDLPGKQRTLAKSLKLNKDILHLLKVIKTLSLIRLNTRFTWVKSGYLLEKVFDEISKRTGLERELIYYCNHKEISNMLRTGKLPDPEKLKPRENFAFLLDGNRLKLFTGTEQLDLLEAQELNQTDYRNINEIKGQIANKGYAKAKVKIINAFSADQEKEIQVMKPGEILMTSMTRPHLIVAMRKSSAIVTDEGGITSHAAIVSRELNKPCVIGTRIATKVFKDGDFVEVDANQGIVRKLKQH